MGQISMSYLFHILDEYRGAITMKTHYSPQWDYDVIYIACMITWWMNAGTEPFPNWTKTTDKEKVTCKRCLAFIRLKKEYHDFT